MDTGCNKGLTINIYKFAYMYIHVIVYEVMSCYLYVKYLYFHCNGMLLFGHLRGMKCVCVCVTAHLFTRMCSRMCSAVEILWDGMIPVVDLFKICVLVFWCLIY
jgi:hypothetical protein